MTRPFDAIVVGLGAMGGASVRALARRGLRVLGLDRHSPPHDIGSSHGRARIIREAYFEHPAYVPFVQRARLLWEEVEREAGRGLLRETGGIMIGPPEGALVAGSLESARVHRLHCERLEAREIRRRFPEFRPDEGMVGVLEPRAGALIPEACVAALIATARRFGATVGENEPVVSWRADGEGVAVETPRGRYHAERLVLAAGSWIARLLPGIELPLEVERAVQFWFQPTGDPSFFDPERCPFSIWEYETDRYFYAFPILDRGVKVAQHHGGEITDPDRLRREVAEEEVESIRALLRRFMPDAAGALESTDVCMYTNTPDSHFILDAHPAHPQALVVSACSGHGFKFAPAIGELVSDLIVEGFTRSDLSLFRIGRWK